MGKLLIGTNEPHEIWLGTDQSFSSLYAGNNLIWEKPAAPWTFFDSGYITDISWTRDFYNLTGSTGASGGSLLQNCIRFYASSNAAYANMSTPVYIPWNVTTLNLQVGRYYDSGRAYPKCSFGLLPNESGITMTSTAQGGILSGTKTVNVSSGSSGYYYTTYTLTIPDEYKCSSDYRIVLNYLGSSASATRSDILFKKVWFT